MKNYKLKYIVLFLCLVLFSWFGAACTGGNNTSIKIELNKTNLSLKIGEEENLIPSILPIDLENKVVTWSSSNDNVATVSALGKVTAISEGIAIITVKTEMGNKTATCSVEVTKDSSDLNFKAKPVDGTPLLFDEGLSYYNINPSIFMEDENNSYIYYTVNNTPDNGRDDVIAVRHGTKVDNQWVYSEKRFVLTTTNNSWDSKRVSNPSVVKGEFEFNSEKYSYLMAYQGNNQEDELNFSIGFAVSKNPEGPFIKIGNESVVNYDYNLYGESWGIGQPSLVSYDNMGCVYLFYTMGDPISTQTYVLSLNCSNLSNIDGLLNASSIATSGLVETNEYLTLNDVDFAIDPTGNYIYCVRNYNPVSSTEPILCTAVQVAKMELDKLFAIDAEWEVVEERLNQLDLFENDNTGWKRVYSGAFMTNAFGKLSNDLKLTLALTVTSWDNDTKEYLYYQAITLYTLDLE